MMAAQAKITTMEIINFVAAAAKEGVKEGVETDAKDAAKNVAAGATKKLRGIFKKN